MCRRLMPRADPRASYDKCASLIVRGSITGNSTICRFGPLSTSTIGGATVAARSTDQRALRQPRSARSKTGSANANAVNAERFMCEMEPAAALAFARCSRPRPAKARIAEVKRRLFVAARQETIAVQPGRGQKLSWKIDLTTAAMQRQEAEADRQSSGQRRRARPLKQNSAHVPDRESGWPIE